MAKLIFDATDIEPGQVFEHIPFTGWLKGMIVSSSNVATKKGDGEFLKLDIEVLDGDFKGRHAFDQLNLDNPNATAVEIAQRTLSAICHAVGKLKIKDSVELHNLPLEFKITVELDDRDIPEADKRAPQNKIKGYRAIEGAAVIVPAARAKKAPVEIPVATEETPPPKPPVRTVTGKPAWMK